jgi:hypothetical protein
MMRVEYLGKQKPAYTSSLAHAYRYALKAGTPMPSAPEQDAWALQPPAFRQEDAQPYPAETPF